MIRRTAQKHSLRRYSILFLSALYISVLHALTYQGSVRGTVTDAQGAAIPNVAITLTNEATGVSRNTTTNSAGQYVFTAVDPGTYSLTAKCSDFKTYQRTNLTV